MSLLFRFTSMNWKRAIAAGFGIYAVVFVVYMIAAELGYVSYEEVTLSGFVLMWVVNVPAVLLLAKWYFKMDAPTAKKGFYLGVVAIIVGFILDSVFVAMSYSGGAPIDQFNELLGSWMSYVTIAEVLLLATYAGYEFDGTYSAPQVVASEKKEEK